MTNPNAHITHTFVVLLVALMVSILFVLAVSNKSSSAKAHPPAVMTPTPPPSPEQVALYKAEHGVSSNADWTPYIKEFDGVEMVLVPVGCFLMGSTPEQLDYAGLLGADLSYIEDEQPAHERCFDKPFWIDRYEVTNAQFAAFSGIAGQESYWVAFNLPRERITWFEAQDFCALRGGRLPTEAEWEYAARGPDALIFPWGNEFDGTRLNYCDKNCGDEYGVPWADNAIDDSYAATAPVGSYELGGAWVGAFDFAGNVWELVDSPYRSYPYAENQPDGRLDARASSYVMRGGAFNVNPSLTRAALRNEGTPTDTFSNVGFRCVRSE